MARRAPMSHHRDTWFSATLLFESRINDIPAIRPLCEERVVLFRARNERDASADAEAYAKAAEHEYENVRGERVMWVFVRVDYLSDVEDPPPGGAWEVASRFVRRSQRTLMARSS